jgi:hypothetical protein
MENSSAIKVEHWHMKDFMPFLIRLAKESDRGAVLIATGYLEKVLKDILVAYFIEGSSSNVTASQNFRQVRDPSGAARTSRQVFEEGEDEPSAHGGNRVWNVPLGP